MADNAGALSDGIAQLRLLSALQRQIGTANPAALAGMRSEIVGTVSAAQSVVQQSRAVIASDNAGRNLAEASSSARNQVSSLARDLHRFDPFLQFDSDEEGAAYRRREGDRLAGIQQQLALNTPQGNLNASGLMVGQMVDAYAHGAGESPEFNERWDALVESTTKLRVAAISNGQSTEAFDNNLRDDLRAILKAKGLTDAQIDAHFVAHADPLEAAKAFVDAQDIASISAHVMENGQDNLATHQQQIVTQPAPPAEKEDTMAGAMAKLTAAGVVATDVETDKKPNHGLVVQSVTAHASSRAT